jgi:hypothetical protein
LSLLHLSTDFSIQVLVSIVFVGLDNSVELFQTHSSVFCFLESKGFFSYSFDISLSIKSCQAMSSLLIISFFGSFATGFVCFGVNNCFFCGCIVVLGGSL